MGTRHRPGRLSGTLLAIVVVVGCVGVAAPAGAARRAAPSDDDCEILLDIQSSGSSSGSELDVLAQEADEFADAAGDVSDRKLKKSLLGLAAVYREASKAKNVAGAGVVMAKRSGKYGKAFGVYAKALTQCSVASVPSGSTR